MYTNSHPMEGSFQITEDSHSFTQFFNFKPNKSQAIEQKKQTKTLQLQNRRKNSTQLSLFGWLTKSRPKQNSQLARLPKDLIINIYSYLRLSDIVTAAQTCFALHECARSIWNDREFFKELQTDKLSEGELRSILEKGGKMGHIRQLRSIYMGKNLKSCRERIKVKVHDTSSNIVKPITGNLLQVFQVSTKSHKPSAFLMDNHLQEIVNSSFRSLVSIKLQSCRYIRKFYDLSKCLQLTSLTITENSYLTNQDMRLIIKYCVKIQNLDLSYCDSLDQGIFKQISKLINLKSLTMNGYQQPFGDLQPLKSLTNLSEVHLENCCILDTEAYQLTKELSSLTLLNVSGCQLLTDWFLEVVTMVDKCCQLEIRMGRTKFGEGALRKWWAHKEEGKNEGKKGGIL